MQFLVYVGDEGLCDFVHLLAGEELVVLVQFDHLVGGEFASLVRGFLGFGRGGPEFVDVGLGDADPAVEVLDEAEPRDGGGFFVELLDIFGGGNYVEGLSGDGDGVWLFGIAEVFPGDLC